MKGTPKSTDDFASESRVETVIREDFGYISLSPSEHRGLLQLGESAANPCFIAALYSSQCVHPGRNVYTRCDIPTHREVVLPY